MIFLDILAYSGSSLGVVCLGALGGMLLHPRGRGACLSVLLTDERARQCVRDGSFTPDCARGLGTLFLLLAGLMGICIARGLAVL
jgi:hypothetical protein